MNKQIAFSFRNRRGFAWQLERFWCRVAEKSLENAQIANALECIDSALRMAERRNVAREDQREASRCIYRAAMSNGRYTASGNPWGL